MYSEKKSNVSPKQNTLKKKPVLTYLQFKKYIKQRNFKEIKIL